MNLYIPFSYLLTTRIKTKHERISWFIIFPAFLILTVILFNGNVLNFIISFAMTMSLYEIGYLDNDFRTVKKEKIPTLRANEQRVWIENNIFSLVAIRLLFSAFLAYYINIDSIQKSFLIVLLICLSLGFYFHNTLRSRWNILTYFIVVLCRYLIPIIVAIDISYYLYLVPFIILVFPIVRTIEHACKEKYRLTKIKKIVRNPDVFRVKWYLVMTFILLIILVFNEVNYILQLIILSIYFLLYRVATLFFSKTKRVLRNKHHSYNWDNNEK